MNTKLGFTLVMLVSILFVGCTKNPNYLSNSEIKKINFLNNSEIKSIFNDKTIKGLYYKTNSNFKITFNSNGTYSGTIYKDNITQPTMGKWFIDNNKNCFIIDRGTYCATYFKKDNKYYTISEDTNLKVSEFIVIK